MDGSPSTSPRVIPQSEHGSTRLLRIRWPPTKTIAPRTFPNRTWLHWVTFIPFFSPIDGPQAQDYISSEHEKNVVWREASVVALVIYGRFNCPFSPLASDRAARLESIGRALVAWRAVEHGPSIPTEGRPVDRPSGCARYARDRP